MFAALLTTLLFATSTFVTNAVMGGTAPYAVDRDFTPVAMLGRGPLMVVTAGPCASTVFGKLTAIVTTSSNPTQI